MPVSFDPISPNERDRVQFDFTDEIGGSGVIDAVTWFCTLSEDSGVIDATPSTRILETPIFTDFDTSVLIGTMVDGAIYTLEAVATLTDGRILSQQGDIACIARYSSDIVGDAISVEQIRIQFPAFSDSSKVSDDTISFWINEALTTLPLDRVRWGQFYNLGIRLWIAHNITLNMIGGTGGAGFGPYPATSKSVNGVSVGYDASVGTYPDGGPYNLTIYGTQFLYYQNMAGAGPYHI